MGIGFGRLTIPGDATVARIEVSGNSSGTYLSLSMHRAIKHTYRRNSRRTYILIVKNDRPTSACNDLKIRVIMNLTPLVYFGMHHYCQHSKLKVILQNGFLETS